MLDASSPNPSFTADGVVPSAEPVLFATTKVQTFLGQAPLTGASGFFFARDDRLYLVTNRHVFQDEAVGHAPDRVEIEIHTDPQDLTQIAVFSIPLYAGGLALWNGALDSGGVVDIAVVEIERGKLPVGSVIRAFSPSHLQSRGEDFGLGSALIVVGFPLGFHDTIHHLAVARSATIASAFGVRFQQRGCFLTDARTHSGSSGAPVLRRRTLKESSDASDWETDWQLLGIHSTRMDMGPRDHTSDESLGLNCVWYADALMALTLPHDAGPVAGDEAPEAAA
ncbi:serine protease [Hydrogenophaga sp. 5NK40-0174]|uniref:S1 family peptidase n=1 Tax=Hydrogenophaga sp. 5NK40-0174 TaxID=3127649 RepID=UPI0031057E80